MKKPHILLILVLFNLCTLYSQSNYNINFPNSEVDRNKACESCFKAFQQKPKEVSFSIKRDGSALYFETNDENWFKSIFKNQQDGIAVDIVDKDRYNCESSRLESSQLKGLLLEPVYKSNLIKGLRSNGSDKSRVMVGRIPEGLRNADLEYNILFLGNNTLCNYYVIYDLKAYSWDLLDMGMYLDSISFTANKINEEDMYRTRYKKMKFVIPFQKNISVYKPEDIKPMYDSLNLTDFNIKKINILAYSSVEGSLDRNLELQQARANSLAKALQSYQKPNIEIEIASSENWVEFLNDITDTKYANLKGMSKSETKAKLDGALNEEMEPILKNHRKAIVSLELDKKDSYKNMSGDELVTSFNSAVQASNVEKAQILLNTIFDNLRFTETNPKILEKLEVPKQKNLANLLNDMSAFKYQLDERNLVIVRDELKEIEKLDPTNKKIKYNLAVLNFKIWRHNVEPINEYKFKNQITALKRYGIPKSLVDRMLINYQIIKSEKFMEKKDYANKDRAVNFIIKNFKQDQLSDRDAISLAQFLSYYSNVDQAAEVLENHAMKLDVDEDLLYYYLNLTMIRPAITQKESYRTIMLNAYSKNKERYCRLFNSVDKGGVTFQLLEDDYLRETYCENCAQ